MTKERVSMVKMTGDHFENLLTQKWLNGKEHVDGELFAYLHELAVEAFLRGDDTQAKLLRDAIPSLLKPFFEKMEKYAKEHAQKYDTDNRERVTEYEE